jgi:hypothetical protein
MPAPPAPSLSIDANPLAAPVINLQLRANYQYYHSRENMNGSELKAKFAECMHVVGKWQLV